MTAAELVLSRDSNQARGLGQFAVDFLGDKWPQPDETVFRMVERFHLDSIACAVSALACQANAPKVLRAEALEYAVPAGAPGVPLLGSTVRVMPEKAVVAGSSAVREWDANGTNFGFNPWRGYTRGEFGHNDFYPVAVAAAQLAGFDGRRLLKAMIAIDEIRGRLAEVFALKNYKIDHVVHGAIASAAVYGAGLGATAEQIESAIGMVVAHYIPFRAIRAGKQLSDSKGASAAISAEVAVLSMRRAIRGFVGPADIFRNPEAIFCLFEKPEKPGTSPFDLALGTSGSDFAVMGMHFKLGLYEHQSAGAIQGLIDLLTAHPTILADKDKLKSIKITIYEPAFGIIGDPAKRDPRTRQGPITRWFTSSLPCCARHTSLSARLARADAGAGRLRRRQLVPSADARIMQKIDFRHGGRPYDEKYPDGIPTTLAIDHAELGRLTSGMVIIPRGTPATRAAISTRSCSTSSACWQGWGSATSTRFISGLRAWPRNRRPTSRG